MKLLMVLLFSLLTNAAFAKSLPTVDYVDVPRYIGKWYAISALPQFFTRNCKSQTAEYDVINSQTISVLNTCLKEKGKETIKGQAVVSNAATNAELIVTFDSFFTRLFRVKGDYNIIKLDKDYQYVMVGSANRKSLWIMSRQPTMPEATYQEYVEYAKTLNFPVDHLVISRF
ncbi:lipocalin family protein [Peredibacter starrii]|uniref:Lipocalin family protein n=1 Tax=Peredibacter starrii TaxID=28202 RepID=A0AAX4HPM7_9BACT|nr:lipocalin family protein [Peredibacter starrii]WPU65067.1 lipocalin family protein [Peredibacter starrii]